MRTLSSRTRSLACGLAAVALLTSSLGADEGTGLGAYIGHTPTRIGGPLTVDLGQAGLAGGAAILAVSDGTGPSFLAGVGTICLDLASPTYAFVVLPLDASGNVSFTLPIPNVPTLVTLPPLYGLCVALDPLALPQWSISKTVRIAWNNTDGYEPIGAMVQARAYHASTSLAADARDNVTKVLITGGGTGTVLAPTATNTTELFDPLTRSFSAGPNMSVPRSFHATVRLNDGRVLITGGLDTAGVVHSSCELYDHATGLITATGAMTTGRSGHGLTLLGDGRVLATGGLNDYTAAGTSLKTALDTAQDTVELYDPTTGMWTALGQTMATKRSGQLHTLLADGRVLITGGLRGGGISTFGFEFPLYTARTELFDPTTDSLSNAGSMGTQRAFHGASQLTDGRVVVTGGSVSDPFFGSVSSTSLCEVWDGTTLWAPTGALSTALSYHTQVQSQVDGTAIVAGGLSGSFPAFAPEATGGRHDGATFTPGADIGTNIGLPPALPAPRGGQTFTRLYDGTYLVLGGTDVQLALGDGFVYLD